MLKHPKKQRAGENRTIPFRSDRFYCVDGAWYFEARGGVQKGPYANREDVEVGLMQFIREQSMHGAPGRRRAC